MVQIKHTAYIFLILPFVQEVIAFDCPSWWPWCSTNNAANSGVNINTTAMPEMTTSQGSLCDCWLLPESRTQRNNIVIELMNATFVNFTKTAAISTKKFQGGFLQNGAYFDLEKAITLGAQDWNSKNDFDFVKMGGLLYETWQNRARGYEFNGKFLDTVIEQIYVNPLYQTLRNIAIEHGTSVGVFRAGYTVTYDGICYIDQFASSPDLDAYLFKQQCQINLSYLVHFTLNGECASTYFEMRAAFKTESAFDNYFPTKDRRYVRSTTRSLTQSNSKTRIVTELFFNTNESITNIAEYLKSMNQISVPACYLKGDVVSSNFSLINCSWLGTQSNNQTCMPQNGTSTSSKSTTLPATQQFSLTSIGSMTPQNGNTILSTLASSSTEIPTANSATVPVVTSQGSSGTSQSTNQDTIPNETSSLSSSSIQPTSTSFTPTTLAPQITTITAVTDSSTSQSTFATDSTIFTTDSAISVTASTVAPTVTSTVSQPTQQVVDNTSSTLKVNLSSQAQSISPTVPSVPVATSTNTGTSSSFANNTTPFDEDPFFRAVVPVFTKKYNDEYLLRAVGTMRPVTSNNDFYWITIPVCIGAVILAMLCLMCLQVDWLAVCGGEMKAKKEIS